MYLRKLKALLSELWFAVRVGAWLCWLPVRVRVHSLPALLHQLTPTYAPQQRKSQLEMERAVQVAVHMCHLRLFHLPLFPRACLRQALTLYSVLTRLGYPVQIHFGVQKAGKELRGHSWVTMHGTPLADSTRLELFTTVYSYPSALFHSSSEAEKFAREER